MCDPLTIVGAVLSAGSVAANTIASSKSAAARNDALLAERIRQRGLDREADALQQGSQDRYKGFEGQQNDRAKDLTELFQEQATEPADASAGGFLPESSSNLTVSTENALRGKARAQTNDRAVRLADVRSFGDLLGDISRKQARDAGQIGQIGGFKAGSQGVLPLELDAAAQAGGKAKLLGDVLGGLGSIGLSAGLSGQNIFGLGGAGANVATQGAGLSAARRAGNMIRLPG